MASKHLAYAKWSSVMRKLDNKIKADYLNRKSGKTKKNERKKDDK